MELAGKNDSIVCSAFYSKFGPWYFDKALGKDFFTFFNDLFFYFLIKTLMNKEPNFW